MKFFKILSVFLLLEFAADAQVNHSAWDALLKMHVSKTGWVSYKGFLNDSEKLDAYLNELSQDAPNKTWSEDEKLAYWINAYNAFTVKLIIDNYPVKSIKDIKKGIPTINSVWDLKFFEIGGEKMDLNHIEHAILRKDFEEPRIHFAIVCASRSCPKLLNEAFTAEKLEGQLQNQAVDFINDESKNEFDKDEIRISQIFNWFKGDFTNGQTIQEYLKHFAKGDFNSDAKVKYLDYDWSLNGE